jgi:hypothetical protein
MRFGGENWRSMQNEGPFSSLVGVEFLHQTSKFWSRGPFRGLEQLQWRPAN